METKKNKIQRTGNLCLNPQPSNSALVKGLLVLFLFPMLLSFWGPNVLAHPVNMQAICEIESNCDDNAKGSVGEIGRYQISPIVLKHFEQVHKRGEKIYVDETFKLECWDKCFPTPKEKLANKQINTLIANWYMNWLFDRCWTVKDTIIAWNFGIGNWREWRFQSVNVPISSHEHRQGRLEDLPKTVQAYLKKYEQLTGEKLQ